MSLNLIYIEIMTACSIMMLVAFIISPMDMKKELFGGIFVPLFVLLVFLLINYLIYLISLIFIRKSYILNKKNIEFNNKKICFSDVYNITFYSGNFSKTRYDAEVLTLFDNEYKTLSQEIPMSDNLWITKNYEHEYIIDNSIGTVNIEVKYLNGIEPKLEIENRKNSNDENYQYCLVTYDTNRYMLYKNILQDIKNKKLIDYENLNSIKLKITVSQENYEKLQQNYEKYCKQY